MAAVVYASRAFNPSPNQLVSWSRHGVTWTGWDGTTFDLRDLRGGVILTNDGLLGLHEPGYEVVASTSPATAGRRRLDARVLERSVKLPVYLWSDDGSAEWALQYRRFFHSFHVLKPGTLTIRTPLGVRTLTCYLDSSGDFQFTRDAAYEGFMRCDVTLTAEDPYWYGDAITRSWTQETARPFLNASDGNLWVSSGASLDTAVLGNPGDVDVWPRWTVTALGEAITARITVDDGVLQTPQIQPGQQLVLDTDPAVQLAMLNGVDVTDNVDPWDPAPIPEGQTVPVSLQLSGLGRVTVEIRPRYLRWL